MIAPHPRAIIQERQVLGVRVDHRQRSQQPLRDLVALTDGFGIARRDEPGQRAS